MRNARFVLAPVECAGVLLFATTSVARADDDCQKRTIKADHNLHEAIKTRTAGTPSTIGTNTTTITKFCVLA